MDSFSSVDNVFFMFSTPIFLFIYIIIPLSEFVNIKLQKEFIRFYKRLVALCDEKEIKVTQLLNELEYSSSKGTAWKGGSIPSGQILSKIADHFDVSVDYLLGRTDTKKLPDKAAKPDILHKYEFLDELDRAKTDSFMTALMTHEKYSNKSQKPKKQDIAIEVVNHFVGAAKNDGTN